MPLKRIVLYLTVLLITGNIYAQQQTADLGLFGGGAIPFTDYSKMKIGQSTKLNYGAFYRYNFNSRYSLRVNALYGNVGASGYLNDMQTPVSFSKPVFDLGALIEINYLDFLLGIKKWNFSPFVSYGLGLSFYSGNVVPNMQFGGGAKYALTKRWAVGAEVNTRKLTNDALDNLDNPYQSSRLPDVNDYWHNNDWITYFGVSLTYKFYWGKTPCPAYGRIND